MSDPNRRYTYLLYHFRLPYRVFLDDGVYWVSSNGVKWRVSLKTLPIRSIDYTLPPIDFGVRAQLGLDNHGFSGFTEVTSGCPLEPPLAMSELWVRQTGENPTRLLNALQPVNRLIALYRAKTSEFWFRPVGAKDIPAFSVMVLPEGSTQMELFLTSTNTQIASRYPYLKSEAWYRDLLARAEREETVPFGLELILEGQDALARGNLRLGATNFALAVESLFRSLVREYFPQENLQRPVEQMVGTYYRRYREVGEPSAVPIRKKEAFKLLRQVWAPRDLLLHGHELDMKVEDVAAAERSTLVLFSLWRQRPNGLDMSIEGPFVNFESVDFPPRRAEDHVERAKERFKGGHLFDAEEAARFALTLDPRNSEALVIRSMVAWQAGRHQEALKYLEVAHEVAPERLDWVPQLENLRRLLASPEIVPPAHIHLLNNVFMLLSDNVTCARNWGFYLFDRAFDGEQELRNKLGCIWLHSLLDSLEAERRILPECERQCKELGLGHLLSVCSQIRTFMLLVRELPGMYTKAEQVFMFDYWGQLVHSFTNRESEVVPITYYNGEQVLQEEMTREDYRDLIRPYYDRGTLDRTLQDLLARSRSPSLRYWRAIKELVPVLDPLYAAMLAGRDFRIPGLAPG